MSLVLNGCSLLQTEDEAAGIAANEVSTTTRPGTKQDAQLAGTALLALTDFGPGWSEVPADPGDPFEDLDDERDRRLSECSGSVGSENLMVSVVGEAKAETGTFTAPDTDSTVNHSVGLSRDAQAAAAAMAGLEDPNLPACLQEVFRWFVQTVIDNPPNPSDTLPEGASIGDVTVARLNVSPVGDQVVAFRTTLPIRIGSLTVTQYFDLVYVRSGRALAQLQFGAVFQPFDTPMFDWMTAVATNKLSAIGVQ